MPNNPAAGRLTQRAQLQRDGGTGQSASGQHAEGWGTYAETWAAVEPLTGREYWQAQQAQATVTHQVTIRYRPGVLRTDRLLVKVAGRSWKDARVLNVEAVRDIEERHEWLVLLCVEAT